MTNSSRCSSCSRRPIAILEPPKSQTFYLGEVYRASGVFQRAVKPIEFDGRMWRPGEITSKTGDVFRPSMVAREYFGQNPDERLLEFTSRNDSDAFNEGVFKRMLFIQVRRDQRWINHGRVAEWMLDGSRSDSEYFEGKIHGTQREWYPDGQLHIERQWANNQMNGRERAWHRNGEPQYEVVNLNGKEVIGKSWDENGKPR